MDRDQTIATLDKILELHKDAVRLKKEFDATKKLLRETQEPLELYDVKFSYEGAIFKFDDEGDLCTIETVESIDEILDKQAKASE